MINVFFLLFYLSSLILLIAGLFKPAIFEKIIKQVPSRKKILSVFFGLMFFSVIIMGVTAPPIEKKVITNTSQFQQKEKDGQIDNTQQVISTSSETIAVVANPAVSLPVNDSKKQNAEAVPTTSKNVVSESQPVVNQENTSVLYSVSSVVDGDTIKVNINGTIETLRLIGMDTPETLDPRKTVQCFGKEASNKAKDLLVGKKVRLETDSTQGDLDKYGRHLAYVYREDGLFYNKYMIEQGYAHEYTYNTPYKYQSEFKIAQKFAQDNLLGLWSPNTCSGNTTQSAITTTPAVTTIVAPAQAPAATPTITNTDNTTVNSQTSKYYTSSHYTAKYYYPAPCSEWQTLSSKYLKVFDSLEALLKTYPSRTLSPQCQ